MTLSALPWKIAPQTVERVQAIEFMGGVLEVPLQGYVSVDELALVGQVDRENQVFRLTSEASVAVSQAEGSDDWPPHVVYGLLARIQACGVGVKGVRFEPEEDALCTRHGAMLGDYLQRIAAVTRQVQTRSALAMLHRLDACRDWDDAHVGTLPDPLKQQLADLFAQEQAAMGGGPSAEEALRELEHQLGKWQAANRSIATDPTGEPSSGPSATSGPPPPSLPPSGSAASRPVTRSKRSRKASASAANTSTAAS